MAHSNAQRCMCSCGCDCKEKLTQYLANFDRWLARKIFGLRKSERGKNQDGKNDDHSEGSDGGSDDSGRENEEDSDDAIDNALDSISDLSSDGADSDSSGSANSNQLKIFLDSSEEERLSHELGDFYEEAYLRDDDLEEELQFDMAMIEDEEAVIYNGYC
ncbi:Oidioi.mRNA.OKI2018_I69.chr1.g2778.t1.cds [Oikopleura dioica]|uniref:Oidioi.mRNA.OKI2018_I69.chr1.g2778.t1.cds n=1 Tax=Oikopleura dioica TaxID=34765 RepID=A0ABN7STV8_OIKDI|nr:Oidioi.mRNA.OKI2018_I69.chr1.g2778.t1.cds [Oikopleura dioica]